MKRITFISALSVLAIVMVACAGSSKTSRNVSTDSIPDNINELMRFTDGYSNNDSRFVLLADCPTTNPYIRTVAKRVNDSYDFDIKIYINKKNVQSFMVYPELPPEIFEVHYLDANFDGYTDFFVGKDEFYANSGIYLWNPDSKRFEYGFGDGMGDFMLDPDNKLCYYVELYNGISPNIYKKCCWDGREMKCIEFVVEDDYYDDNLDEYQDLYFVGTVDPDASRDSITIKKSKTSDKNQLPQWWKDLWRLEQERMFDFG